MTEGFEPKQDFATMHNDRNVSIQNRKGLTASLVLFLAFCTAAGLTPVSAQVRNSGNESEELRRIVKIEEEKQWVKICEQQRKSETGDKIRETIGVVPALILVSLLTPATSFSSSTTTAQQECYKDHSVSNATQQQLRFVASAYYGLAEHSAQGKGEHVLVLAALMGCPTTAHLDFSQLVRRKFERLFPAGRRDPIYTLFALKTEMAVHGKLSALCTSFL